MPEINFSGHLDRLGLPKVSRMLCFEDYSPKVFWDQNSVMIRDDVALQSEKIPHVFVCSTRVVGREALPMDRIPYGCDNLLVRLILFGCVDDVRHFDGVVFEAFDVLEHDGMDVMFVKWVIGRLTHWLPAECISNGVSCTRHVFLLEFESRYFLHHSRQSGGFQRIS